MKRRIFAYSFALLASLCCLTACTKDEVPTTGSHSIHYEYTPSATTAPTTQPSVAPLPDEATQEATEEATSEAEEPTTPAPQAPQKYRNEYTADGDPVIVYEVLGYGDKAVYSGNYERYVYRNGTVSTVEKWTKSENGDQLLSTTDYEYDSKGTVRTVSERLPDANGELYLSSLTESVNNPDGTPATKSIIRYGADGNMQTQTVYGYSYDDYGREILCTLTVDGQVQSQTESVYTFEGKHLRQKSETTTANPGTPYARISSLTLTYDDNGNVTVRTEQDASGSRMTTYEYDALDREINTRTETAGGEISAYTITSYEDIGGGSTRVKVMLFDGSGAMYAEQITCYDAQDNAFIPVIE